MVNAGRVLIIPRGEYDPLESYNMLDLVTYDNIAYLARKASVGVNPSTDTQNVYWQPFGSATSIATTAEAGIVKPDGTTIFVEVDGTITAGISETDWASILSILA